MRLPQRSFILAALTALAMGVFPGVSGAGELDDVLADARTSTYTASRLVVSLWGGQTQVSRQLVIHTDDMEIVRTDSSWSMTGYGKAVSMGDEPSGIAFLSRQPNVLASRYTVVERGAVRHMSRPGRMVDIMEGDVLRASLLIDKRSGALLIQDLFSSDGSLYRRTTLTDFRMYRTYQAPMDPTEVPTEIVMPEHAYLLPVSVAGYARAGTFGVTGGSEHGYYTDGLFEFSLFILDGNTAVPGLEEAMAFVVESGVYQIVPTAQEVRIHWSNGSNTFVLVGDLPPDHLANVLNELPSPATPNIIARWLKRFFG